VLTAVVQQAQLDAQVEDAKATIPTDVSLDAIFETLDRFRKGYITDTDLWSFCQQFGGQTSFGSLCALAHEVQLRRKQDFDAVPSRLSFRELGSLLLRVGTEEHEVVSMATTDDQARTASYLLRNSESCPGCSMRIQRDADAAGCPMVTCTMCATPFRCFALSSDVPRYSPPLSVSVQYHLYRLLDTAAAAALQLESSRKQLAQPPSGDVLCTLSAVFAHMADGRLAMSMADLRRTLASHDIFASEEELSLLCHRYVRRGATEVVFAEFLRQLTPRASSMGL